MRFTNDRGSYHVPCQIGDVECILCVPLLRARGERPAEGNQERRCGALLSVVDNHARRTRMTTLTPDGLRAITGKRETVAWLVSSGVAPAVIEWLHGKLVSYADAWEEEQHEAYKTEKGLQVALDNIKELEMSLDANRSE